MKTMNIYSKPGTKVVFAYPDNGYPSEKETVKKLGLKLGEVYTVKMTIVSQSSTSVYLEEFPCISFNSVHFEDFEPVIVDVINKISVPKNSPVRKLIKTEDYLLYVEKVNGFKNGEWNYEEDNHTPVYYFTYDLDQYPGNKIIAHLPLNKTAKVLPLPLLPEIIQTHSYTLTDIREAFNAGYDFGVDGYRGKSTNPPDEDDYIRQLTTPIIPTHFEPNVLTGYWANTIWVDYPEQDYTLEFVTKNGKIHLLGEYKY